MDGFNNKHALLQKSTCSMICCGLGKQCCLHGGECGGSRICGLPACPPSAQNCLQLQLIEHGQCGHGQVDLPIVLNQSLQPLEALSGKPRVIVDLLPNEMGQSCQRSGPHGVVNAAEVDKRANAQVAPQRQCHFHGVAFRGDAFSTESLHGGVHVAAVEMVGCCGGTGANATDLPHELGNAF